MPPWMGVWRCGCSDIEHRAAKIPDRCPEHDAELIRDNSGAVRFALDDEPTSYGVRANEVIL